LIHRDLGAHSPIALLTKRWPVDEAETSEASTAKAPAEVEQLGRNASPIPLRHASGNGLCSLSLRVERQADGSGLELNAEDQDQVEELRGVSPSAHQTVGRRTLLHR
jgi:hypothetical protein